MKIIINDDKTGTFFWELPPDLTEKWEKILKNDEIAGKAFVEILRYRVHNFLVILSGVLDVPPQHATKLLSLINDQLVQMAADLLIAVQKMPPPDNDRIRLN